MHTSTHTSMHTSIYAQYIYTYIYIHIYIYTYTYTYIYIQFGIQPADALKYLRYRRKDFFWMGWMRDLIFGYWNSWAVFIHGTHGNNDTEHHWSIGNCEAPGPRPWNSLLKQKRSASAKPGDRLLDHGRGRDDQRIPKPWKWWVQP